MGAPGFDLMGMLAKLKGLIPGMQGNAAPVAATDTGGALGPQNAAGDMLSSMNPGAIQPATMQTPGQGAGTPPAPIDPQKAQLLKLAQYAQVMKGIGQSNQPDHPPSGPERSPALNLASNLKPALSPIAPQMRPAPAPRAVGASLASPEGQRLIAALDQMNQGAFS